jgi:outer membrane protein
MKPFILFFLFLAFVLSKELSLEDCIQIGLNNKSTLKSASSGKSAADQSVKNSFSNLLPSASFSGNLNRTYFPKTNISSAAHSQIISSGIGVNQKVYDGGKIINQIKQAKSFFRIASFSYQSTRLTTIRDVILGYFELLKAKELKEVASQNLALTEKQLNLVKTKFGLGAVKKTDLLKGKVTRGQAQSEFLQSAQVLRRSRRNFYHDMGIPDGGEKFIHFLKEIKTYLLPEEEKILIIIEENNPDLLSKKSQIQSAKLKYKIARGMRLPSINAGLNYSVTGEDAQAWMDNFKEGWNLGVNISVSIPIYTGNSLSTQIEQSRIEWNQTTEDYTSLKENLNVQALDLLEILNQYTDILPIQSQVVESAQEDLILVQKRYSLGSATILEVLDAQVSLNLAKTTWVNMKYDFWISATSLKALTGELNTDFGMK